MNNTKSEEKQILSTDLKQKAQTLLFEIAHKACSGTTTGKYLKDWNPKDTSYSVNTTEDGGWLISVGYENHVELIPNPDKTASQGLIPSIKTKDGILLHIYIYYKKGDVKLRRTKDFKLSEDPRLGICYQLKTKENEANFSEEFDKFIEESIKNLNFSTESNYFISLKRRKIQ
ncbi:MAG: hypothetical protein HC904_10540 [Blastochloris sp.]|nr:hypothetical protein [Blastochloris sp.]